MSNSLNPRIVVEIDLPYCDNVYGVAPCTAVVGATGADKCYNCIRTCQDRANFTESVKTLRLCDQSPDPYYTLDGTPVSVIPSIASVNTTPAVVKPGIDSGERETVQIVCAEHPDSDTLLDKYYAERSYEPLQQGTFWAKVRARWVDLTGSIVRVKRGYAGQDLNTYNTRYYVVSGISGGGQKSVTIKASDPFSLADGKKSKAPVASNGSLLAAITDVATSATLTPSGVGNAEYPSSGELCLGSKEVCAFTRSGDVLTLTRGIAGTEAQDHEADTGVQLVLKYASQNGGEIIADLLENYTDGIDAAWVDAAAFQTEISTYYGTVFNARITAPTAVKTLIDELIAQLPAVFFWDSTAQQFRLFALRPAAGDEQVAQHFLDGSFSITEQPSKRASEVLTYYGQRDPTASLTEQSNYACQLLLIDDEADADYTTTSTKTVYSRWINQSGRAIAQVLNATLLERYRDPPRQLSFKVWRNHTPVPELGQILRLTHTALQEPSGAQSVIPAQMTSVEVGEGTYECTAEEIVYRAQEGSGSSGVRFVYIDVDTYNVNLRDLYDSLYTSLDGITEVRLVVAAGVYIGSLSTSAYSLEILSSDWPVDVLITWEHEGYCLGKGGDGHVGQGDPRGLPAQNGGPALLVTRPVTIRGAGTIGGGGGAGSTWSLHTPAFRRVYPYKFFAGRGGAGFPEGLTGGAQQATRAAGDVLTYSALFGTSSATGVGDERTYRVTGGNLGQAGTTPTLITDIPPFFQFPWSSIHFYYSPAGAAGAAVVGYSNLTFESGSSITVLGPTS